jgi:Ubiquitin carboxyl-terminal hydrolase
MNEGFCRARSRSARGLRNIGNNCFLNSILQSLSSCPSFHQYLERLLKRSRNAPFAAVLHQSLVALRETEVSGHCDDTVPNTFDAGPISRKISLFNPLFDNHDQQVCKNNSRLCQFMFIPHILLYLYAVPSYCVSNPARIKDAQELLHVVNEMLRAEEKIAVAVSRDIEDSLRGLDGAHSSYRRRITVVCSQHVLL